MSNEPRVAVLGCGAWGSQHVRVWTGLGCLAVVADRDELRLEALRARHPGLETSTDVIAVLDRPDVDAVVIATPAPTHAELAIAALERGKDVLVEKPLALRVDQGSRVVATARERGRILQIGHVLEYHPAIRMLRSLAASGELGRIQYVYSHRLNLGRIRTEENALWSFAPHDIAILLRLLGAAPVEVTCRGSSWLSHGVADVTMTTLAFPGSVRAHVFVSWLHPFKEHRFIVVGDRQMAVFDDTLPWSDKLSLYPHRVDWVDGRIPEARRAEAIRVPLVEGEPLRLECEDFLRSIRSRGHPLADGDSALEVLRVLERAQASLEAGERPSPPEPVAARTGIHPTATVDPGATIGEGTRIWHYTHVTGQARIGARCVLGQNVYVGNGVRIGDGVKIQNNVSVYEAVTLEDEVFCGPSAVFTNVINPRSHIERKHEFRPTLVRRRATIGANATIVCGVTIGAYAFVAAGAVVTHDVPDHALVLGVPARRTGWVCACGERLELAEDRAACNACGLRYRLSNPNQLERIVS